MGISRLLTNLKKDKMLRRNRIGTRSADLWAWEIEDFSNMQGPLAVQEYIQELIRNDPSNVKKIVEPPPDVDVNVWQYEHLRQFILELNLLVTQLKGVCTPASCPTMKATEDWLYRCAVHKSPQECSAIDYMIHNLDQATSILQNVKIYSSRVSIPPSAVKNLGPIVRRLYRLFSHTYFNHKEIFMEFEVSSVSQRAIVKQTNNRSIERDVSMRQIHRVFIEIRYDGTQIDDCTQGVIEIAVFVFVVWFAFHSRFLNQNSIQV
eukprot:TRINITY_DN2223_c0_g1_i4.p1 TRINITY_DN2223_c0_g1~~TRINITY_DN2223_c0_g1_i4.p1  ORF type:complete len:263 (-),score=15.00 TRINITY_DN2223_c0_g1_i4:171-959(-)